MIDAIQFFLAGGTGKVLGILALVLALAGGSALWLHEHDVRVLAEQAAAEAMQVSAEQAREHQAAIAALQAQHAADLARLRATTAVKQEIARAPITTACAASPAVSAAAAELRRRAGPGAGQAGRAGGAADLRGPAHPP
jgi:uncharacterized protein HemX